MRRGVGGGGEAGHAGHRSVVCLSLSRKHGGLAVVWRD